MLKIAPALALPFLSLAAADDGAAVLGVAAGARNGVVAGTNLGGVAIGALNDLEGLDRDLGHERGGGGGAGGAHRRCGRR